MMKKIWLAVTMYGVMAMPALADQPMLSGNDMPAALKRAMEEQAAERGQKAPGAASAADQLPDAGKAAESPEAPPEPCTPLLGIATSYAITGDSYKDVKAEFDGRMARVEQYVTSQGIAKFQVESLSYTIRHEKGYPGARAASKAPAGYKLSGNAEFHVDSSEDAFKIGQYLTQEKFEVTVSNKAIPNPACIVQQKYIMPGQLPRKAAPKTPAIPVPTGTPPQLEK